MKPWFFALGSALAIISTIVIMAGIVVGNEKTVMHGFIAYVLVTLAKIDLRAHQGRE